MKNDKITGEWYANGKNGKLKLMFADKPVKTTYEYESVGEKKAKGVIDNDLNGWWNDFPLEGVNVAKWLKYNGGDIGKFTAKTKVISDLPTKASGSFVISEDNGRFDLFYQKEKFGSGQLYEHERFFDL